MKISPRLIVFTLAAGLILTLLLWYSRREEKTIHDLATEKETSTPASNAPHESGGTSMGDTTNFEQTQLTIPSGIEQTYEQQMSQAMQGKNVPIEFWGKIVNQDGEPLSGATVKGHVRTWVSMQGGMTAFPQLTATSANDGRFRLYGAKGDLLEIKAVEKNGYEVEPGALRSFGFNTSEQFRSDPDLPVILRMWQTNIHQPLLTGQKSFHIEPDGRAYVINLQANAISESGEGDLKVSLRYTKEATPGQTNNWLAELVVIDGGLIEETDPNSSMYLAPANEYTPTFRYDQQIKVGQRGSIGTKRFFVMLKNGGEYGRVTVEMFAPYNALIPGLIRIQYVINSSGSRVLR